MNKFKRPKGSKNKSKKHPSDRPELLVAQIEQNQLEHPLVKLTLKSVGGSLEEDQDHEAEIIKQENE